MTAIGLTATIYFVALLRAGHDTESWTTTTGVITDSRQRFWEPQVRYTYQSKHKHRFEGRQVRLTSRLTFSDIYRPVRERYPIGSQVTVHYDRYSPGRAVLEPGAPRGAERIGIAAIALLAGGLVLLWRALRRLHYARFDTAEAGMRILVGFVAAFTIVSGVYGYVWLFVLQRWNKFGGVAGWISGTLWGAVLGAMLGGVLLLSLRINERWLPEIPRRIQIATGAVCGLVTAAGWLLPTSHSTISDHFVGALKIALAAGILSLFIVLLVGSRTAASHPPQPRQLS